MSPFASLPAANTRVAVFAILGLLVLAISPAYAGPRDCVGRLLRGGCLFGQAKASDDNAFVATKQLAGTTTPKIDSPTTTSFEVDYNRALLSASQATDSSQETETSFASTVDDAAPTAELTTPSASGNETTAAVRRELATCTIPACKKVLSTDCYTACILCGISTSKLSSFATYPANTGGCVRCTTQPSGWCNPKPASAFSYTCAA
ncbi:hypothetical protein Agub_g3853 [Astrephomene gubernaculifera]|uniref:Uncharacterized protein n=1 Tax=Astrephomene gubernaculifera TaxID=47775 RepID=A0AAD3HJ97_9CHLO|nr:hypothetical protein Agub_g3853 [Astrephomene gubernaculifera]